jgi:thiol-disulfide isomerase/thioredoxin
MLKKMLVTIGATLLIALVLFMVYGIVEKVIDIRRAGEKELILNEGSLFNTDSTTYQVDFSNPIILIYFNSECEHCQYEATEIKKSISLFSKTSILMISSEPIEAIKVFSGQYELSNEPAVTFAKINRDDVYKTFGSVSIPHIFIYGKDHKLVKEFKGETKIEAILKYLP